MWIDGIGADRRPRVPHGDLSMVPSAHTAGSPSAAPPQASAAPSGAIGLGTTPVDWKGLIQADPGYIAWKANATKGLGDLATNRSAAIKALVLQYGGIPKGFQDKFGDLGAADIQAGADNPFSVEHMIQKSYDQGVLAMKQSAAARGMLQSGELGYGQDQQDQRRGQDEYNAGGDFSKALNDVLSGYTTGVDQINGGEGGAINSAEGNVIAQNPQPAPISADLVPNWQQYGQPVYQGPGGALYDAHGNPFTPTAAAPPPPAATWSAPQRDPGLGHWGGYE